MTKSRRGFTLIELLIVIALLGALAVGLIGALDPFEQLKKGADTGTRDLTNQVQTAIIRYYSIKNEFPWGVGTQVSAEDLTGTNMSGAIANMVNAGELASTFTTVQSGNLNKIFVTGGDADNQAIVCYHPTSKSFQADPNTKFDIYGGDISNPTTECEGNGGGTVCYWCIR